MIISEYLGLPRITSDRLCSSGRLRVRSAPSSPSATLPHTSSVRTSTGCPPTSPRAH